MEHFEEEKQNEEEESMMMWTCEACTYVNPIISEQCEICQQAAPVTKPTEIVYEKVEATDLSKAEGKLL